MAKTKFKPMSKAKQDALLEALHGDLKAAWGSVQSHVEMVSNHDDDLFHNPALKSIQKTCDCIEYREARGVHYCVRCWPLYPVEIPTITEVEDGTLPNEAIDIPTPEGVGPELMEALAQLFLDNQRTEFAAAMSGVPLSSNIFAEDYQHETQWNTSTEG